MFAKIRGTVIFFDVDGATVACGNDRTFEQKIAFFDHDGPGVDHVGMKAGSKDFAARFQAASFDHRGHGIRAGRA